MLDSILRIMPHIAELESESEKLDLNGGKPLAFAKLQRQAGNGFMVWGAANLNWGNWIQS